MGLVKVCSAVCLLVAVLFCGCVGDSPVRSTLESASEVSDHSTVGETRTGIEGVSGELDTLRSNGWNRLAGELGRSKTTTVLWYHLRTRGAVDPKVVFGSPRKLDSAVAIQAGESNTFPTIEIKGVDYYIIDPTVPEIVREFKYGDMFDDPGNNYLASNFRLDQADIDEIEQWMKETGVSIDYTDFPIE